ncbi:MAG TPA: hypothetical protein VM487_26490 [Phycisphaerae bacterium]|nr:hypothetical protein [Phycisphaerae bacterium]
MHRNPEKVSEVLALVQKLLDAGKPKEAVELIRRFGTGSPEVSNAYGVSLMRAGEIAKAIEVYRNLVISESGVCLKINAPTLFKTNFATALLLAKNVSGCLSVLQEINDEQNAAVMRLRAAITRWRQSLTWWQRLWFELSGEAPDQAVPLDFQPGELFDTRELRPAA